MNRKEHIAMLLMSSVLCLNFYMQERAEKIYNISNENSVASIAEVARICAEIAGTKVVFDSPDSVEAKGFSKSKNCILDSKKLRDLGWNGRYSLRDGLAETLECMRRK